ncbi:MAG TPA: preprotein translocase subunit SecG [Synergistales bacterium]|nr:preprotein translocase subunit SecG [Synergistales bacterium]
MKLVLGVVHIILSIALISVVMLQHRKQGGFSGIFGGGTQADMGGSQWQRFTALTKITVVLAAIFMLTSLVLVMISL